MQILNRHHIEHRWPPGAVYIGRGTPLGNPFRVGADGDRAEVVARYAQWLDARYAARDPVLLTALAGLGPHSALVCSCAPAPCHGSAIAALWPRFDAERPFPRPTERVYAGIGSRRTPPRICAQITEIARRLRARGWRLRSGGARGADAAFEAGAGADADIFLPFAGFNGHAGGIHPPAQRAFEIARAVHPAWDRMGEAAQKLQGRNTHQVLGAQCDSPVHFVCCWSPDGAERESDRTRETGGTGQAIALADRWGAPCFNLARPGALLRLKDLLEQRESAAA